MDNDTARNTWQRIVKEAKAHQGLSSWERRMRSMPVSKTIFLLVTSSKPSPQIDIDLPCTSSRFTNYVTPFFPAIRSFQLRPVNPCNPATLFQTTSQQNKGSKRASTI
jgi:hypothetical protein